MANKIKEEAKRLAAAMNVPVSEILDIVDAGFIESDDSEYRRLVVASSSLEKTGKTHWALHTPPAPVALIDFDIGTEGVVNKRDHNRMIIHKEFNMIARKEIEGKVPRQQEYEDEWSDCLNAIRVCVASPLIRTLVIDTGSEAWELARLAEFGKLEQVKSHHYGGINREYRRAIQMAYERKNLNLIVTHKVKKAYKDDKWDGKSYERSGFGDMAFAVQVNIEHFVDEGEDAEDDEFGIRVLNCRQRPELRGLELAGPLCSFAVLGRKVFPNSTKDDWS